VSIAILCFLSANTIVYLSAVRPKSAHAAEVSYELRRCSLVRTELEFVTRHNSPPEPTLKMGDWHITFFGPYRPNVIWGASLAGWPDIILLPLWPFFIATAALTTFLIRNRSPKIGCRKCGYSLTGPPPNSPCPECGTPSHQTA
jgi:hypothetical protein